MTESEYQALLSMPAPQQDENLFWRALGVLSRPNSAIMGAVTEASKGGDVLGAVGKSLTGEAQYSGRDVLDTWGMPDIPYVKAGAGLVMDALNPLDPLNWIGLGTATKAGKAAKLLGKSTRDLGLAAKAGERGLVMLGGKTPEVLGNILEPVLGKTVGQTLRGERALVEGAPVLGAAGKAADYARDTAVGKELSRLFGGSKGYQRANPELWGTPEGTTVNAALDETSRLERLFNLATDETIDSLRTLTPDQRATLTNIGELSNRGDLTPENVAELADKFGLGTAHESISALNDITKQWQERLGGFGSAAWENPGPYGHIPRIIEKKRTLEPGVESLVGEYVGVSKFDPKPGTPEDNAFNWAIRSSQQQPRRVGVRATGETANGIPQTVSATIKELNEGMPTSFMKMKPAVSPFEYSTDIEKILRHRTNQVIKEIKTDEFVQIIEREGFAVPWDEASHGAGDFVKVDQGRWSKKPLAVPQKFADLYQSYVREVVNPENALAASSSGVMGNIWREVMSWMKSDFLYPIPVVGSPAREVRNFATGVAKNFLGGLTPFGRQFDAYYGAAMNTVKDMGFHVGQELKGEFKLVDSGLQIDRNVMMQEYVGHGMGGGGGSAGRGEMGFLSSGINAARIPPPPSAFDPYVAGSKRLRQKAFAVPIAINERVELMNRLPLALKYVDDTLKAAMDAGVPVPGRITADTVSHPVVQQAMKSAREAVAKLQFDYSDLSATEKKIRDNWIPFYTWMRKNIPSETVNILTQPGKYMPYVRAYESVWQNGGVSPDTAPDWILEDFGFPLSKDAQGKQQYGVLTGFLPVMDIMQPLSAIASPNNKDVGGRDTIERMARWGLGNMNPILNQVYEQALGRDLYSGKRIGKETPGEVFGVTMPSRLQHMTDVVGTVGAFDRLNPFDVWNETGKLTGNISEDATRRPSRNEPEQTERWIRFLTGVKTYAPDQTPENVGAKAKRRKIQSYMSRARRARMEGDLGAAQYYQNLAQELTQ